MLPLWCLFGDVLNWQETLGVVLPDLLLCVQEKAKLSLPFHKAQFGYPRATAPLPVPASTALLGRTSSDSLQTTHHLGPSCSPMEGLPLPNAALPGAPLHQASSPHCVTHQDNMTCFSCALKWSCEPSHDMGHLHFSRSPCFTRPCNTQGWA